MTTGKKSVSHPNAPGSIANQGHVEYANGRASRYLPGVSIVGQPAVQVKRVDRRKQIQYEKRSTSQTPNATPTVASKSLQKLPANASSAPVQIGPLTPNQAAASPPLASTKAMPSIFGGLTAPADQNQIQSLGVLSKLADQILSDTSGHKPQAKK
jgi:hypothetical protein